MRTAECKNCTTGFEVTNAKGRFPAYCSDACRFEATPCGTEYKYWQGCRCEDCSAVKLTDHARTKAMYAERGYDHLGHGKANTYKAGCRCDECFAAKQEADAEWYNAGGWMGLAARNANIKAAELGVPGTLTAADIQALFEQYPACCACGTTKRLSIDHVVPFSNEDCVNEPDNLQVLCLTHNSIKRSQVIDYRMELVA